MPLREIQLTPLDVRLKLPPSSHESLPTCHAFRSGPCRGYCTTSCSSPRPRCTPTASSSTVSFNKTNRPEPDRHFKTSGVAVYIPPPSPLKGCNKHNAGFNHTNAMWKKIRGLMVIIPLRETGWLRLRPLFHYQ